MSVSNTSRDHHSRRSYKLAAADMATLQGLSRSDTVGSINEFWAARGRAMGFKWTTVSGGHVLRTDPPTLEFFAEPEEATLAADVDGEAMAWMNRQYGSSGRVDAADLWTTATMAEAYTAGRDHGFAMGSASLQPSVGSGREKEMEQLLLACSQQFRRYEAHHRDKVSNLVLTNAPDELIDEARTRRNRNAEMAERIEGLLGKGVSADGLEYAVLRGDAIAKATITADAIHAGSLRDWFGSGGGKIDATEVHVSTPSAVERRPIAEGLEPETLRVGETGFSLSSTDGQHRCGDIRDGDKTYRMIASGRYDGVGLDPEVVEALRTVADDVAPAAPGAIDTSTLGPVKVDQGNPTPKERAILAVMDERKCGTACSAQYGCTCRRIAGAVMEALGV